VNYGLAEQSQLLFLFDRFILLHIFCYKALISSRYYCSILFCRALKKASSSSSSSSMHPPSTREHAHWLCHWGQQCQLML